MRKRYFLLAGLGALAALVSQLPLSWVAPSFMPKGLGQDIQYSGTVWNGRVNGLDYLGAANFKLNPKALITGGLPLSFNTQSPAMALSGQASRNQLKDVRFSGTLAKLPTRDGRLKELAGQVSIRVSDLKIKDGGCATAAGQSSTDFLTANQSRWQWRGPKLAGPISCEGGDLIAKLSGQENGQIVRADLRLSPNGGYAANITVQTNQAEAGVVLPLYGFEALGREYKLTEQGQWR
ncbi:MAG: type II secretion system protein N [Hellea sp.]